MSKQKTIKLLKPHTHAGRDYPPNTVLTLDADSADWLIGLGSAKDAAPEDTKTTTKKGG